MIRRLLALTALAFGLMVVSAGSADAAGGNIACAYNTSPLNIGICVGI
jgi:hypothetical protein